MIEPLNQIFSLPIFGISLTLICYCFGVMIQKKTKTMVANPMLLTTVMIIAFLSLMKIPIESYNTGGQILSLFLGPATVALAIPLCKQIKRLQANWQAILVGTFSGALTGILSSTGLALAFKASPQVALSLVPKSVTTPIAMEVAGKIGGFPPLTAGAVAIAGIVGALIGPELLKRCGIHNDIAKGIAIGAASHALGTTRVLQESQLQGAMSSVSIALVGTFTALLAPLLIQLWF